MLGDRYISSTVAYQGAGGLDSESILSAGRIAVGTTWPDLTLILDLPAERGLERVRGKTGGGPGALDRMESKNLAFHRKVRKLFLKQAADDPRHFAVVNASVDVEQVRRRIVEVLATWPWPPATARPVASPRRRAGRSASDRHAGTAGHRGTGCGAGAASAGDGQRADAARVPVCRPSRCRPTDHRLGASQSAAMRAAPGSPQRRPIGGPARRFRAETRLHPLPQLPRDGRRHARGLPPGLQGTGPLPRGPQGPQPGHAGPGHRRDPGFSDRPSRPGTRARQGQVFVVLEADLLSDSAQNALLKTLEEPPPGVTIILICRPGGELAADHAQPVLWSQLRAAAAGVRARSVAGRCGSSRPRRTSGPPTPKARWAPPCAWRSRTCTASSATCWNAWPDLGAAGETDLGEHLAKIAEHLTGQAVAKVKQEQDADLSKQLAHRRAGAELLAWSPASSATPSPSPPVRTARWSTPTSAGPWPAWPADSSALELARMIEEIDEYERLLWRNVNPR